MDPITSPATAPIMSAAPRERHSSLSSRDRAHGQQIFIDGLTIEGSMWKTVVGSAFYIGGPAARLDPSPSTSFIQQPIFRDMSNKLWADSRDRQLVVHSDAPGTQTLPPASTEHTAD